MKATIRDRAALASVSPIDIGTYLRSSGWALAESSEDKASVWTKRDGAGPGEYEVLLPQRREFRDFPERVAELLQTLEAAENRSQIEILSHHEQAGPGRVTVEALVEDRIRNVIVELDETSYSVAAMAHDKRLPIYCEGELAKIQRSYRLNNPRGFDLYRKDDDASAAVG